MKSLAMAWPSVSSPVPALVALAGNFEQHPVRHDAHRVNHDRRDMHQDRQNLPPCREKNVSQDKQNLHKDWSKLKSDMASGNTAQAKQDLSQLHQDQQAVREDRQDDGPAHLHRWAKTAVTCGRTGTNSAVTSAIWARMPTPSAPAAGTTGQFRFDGHGQATDNRWDSSSGSQISSGQPRFVRQPGVIGPAGAPGERRAGSSATWPIGRPGPCGSDDQRIAQRSGEEMCVPTGADSRRHGVGRLEQTTAGPATVPARPAGLGGASAGRVRPPEDRRRPARVAAR